MDPSIWDGLMGSLFSAGGAGAGPGMPKSLLPMQQPMTAPPDFMKLLMGGQGGPGMASLIQGLMGAGHQGAAPAAPQMAGISKGPTGMMPPPTAPMGAGPLQMSQAIRRF